MEMERKSDILVVAVLYKENLSDSKAWQTLLRDCPHVYIHDNSPEAACPENLPDGWVYRNDPSNPGLSAAYNAAARYAKEMGFHWLLLTDHDTTYPPGALRRMEELTKEYPDESLLVPQVRIPDGRYLSPVPLRNFFTRLEQTPLRGEVELRKTAVINSGMLVSLDVFLRCGGYNEKVFLDFSDFQFIDRLSRIAPTGKVTDMELTQAFSGVEDTPERALKRFEMFCRSVRGYESGRNIRKGIALRLAILKRSLSLSLRLRSLEPVGMMMKSKTNNEGKPGAELNKSERKTY